MPYSRVQQLNLTISLVEGKITSQNGVRDRDFFAIFWDFLDYFLDFFWIFGIFGIFFGDFWDLLDFFSEKCTGFFSSDFPLAR